MKIETHTPNTGHTFFYVKTDYGVMCSFDSDFGDVWFLEGLESDEPIDGPGDAVICKLINEAAA